MDDMIFRPIAGKSRYSNRAELVCAATCAQFAANYQLFGGPSLKADEDTHFGDSVLVFSTKKGILQVQGLWHSSRAMIR